MCRKQELFRWIQEAVHWVPGGAPDEGGEVEEVVEEKGCEEEVVEEDLDFYEEVVEGEGVEAVVEDTRADKKRWRKMLWRGRQRRKQELLRWIQEAVCWVLGGAPDEGG